MPHYTRTALKICVSGSCGVMNPNLKFLVVYMELVRREVQLQPSLKHDGGLVLFWGCIYVSGVGDLCKTDGL